MAMRISTEGVAGLGDRLGEIADYLQERASGTRAESGDSYGFVDATAIGAYDSVLGDYELARRTICADLRRLRDLAHDAGACYIENEAVIGQRLRRLL